MRKLNKKKYVAHQLCRFQLKFMDSNCRTHNSYKYYWIDVDNLLCSPVAFFSNELRKQGFIEDDGGVAYPIENVLKYWLEPYNTCKVFVLKTENLRLFYDDEYIQTRKVEE